MKEFHTLIRKTRLDKGYSQDYVSSRVGITLSAFSKIERGITNPSLSRMKQIAEVLEVDLSILFKPKDYPHFSGVADPGGANTPVSRYEFDAYVALVRDLQERLRDLNDRLL
ncbi:helix-turn-helix domain-containing protein [Aquirufa sp. A-Brett2-W8]|jgi:transcriptional regulator with XRE-family HTH domain